MIWCNNLHLVPCSCHSKLCFKIHPYWLVTSTCCIYATSLFPSPCIGSQAASNSPFAQTVLWGISLCVFPGGGSCVCISLEETPRSESNGWQGRCTLNTDRGRSRELCWFTRLHQSTFLPLLPLESPFPPPQQPLLLANFRSFRFVLVWCLVFPTLLGIK